MRPMQIGVRKHAAIETMAAAFTRHGDPGAANKGEIDKPCAGIMI